MLNTKAKKIITANIQLCFPHLTCQQQKQCIYRAMVASFQAIAESPWLLLRDSAKIYQSTQWKNFSLLENALANKKQILLLGCHFGAFPVMTTHAKLPLVWLSKKQKGIFEFFFENAKKNRFGSFATPTSGGLRSIVQSLRKGKHICILCDHDPGSRSGRIKSSFFGNNAYSTTLPHKLITRAPDIQVFFWITMRMSFGRGFVCCFFEADKQVYSANLATSVQAINTQLEHMIYRKPEQYHWLQERFRRTHRNMYKFLK